MAIQSVKKALGILALFSSTRPNLGIADISRLMGLPKPTVHGLVQTLHEDGFLSQDHETRKYAIGLKVVELGTILASNLKINQVGNEAVQRLSINTQHSAKIAIWDNDSMLITLNAFPTVDYFHYQQIGPRVPAYCTGIGKAVLSALPQSELSVYLNNTQLYSFTPNTLTSKEQLLHCLEKARQTGYATEKSELLVGVGCIAVPVFDQTGSAIAAISLSGTPDILLDEKLKEVVSQLIQTGIEVSRRMGYRPEAIQT